MAALTVSYSVGDTVYVTYPFPDSLYFSAQSRVVSQIKLTAAGDVAVVSFTSGNQVQDSDATPRIYLTEALASTAIVDDIISRSASTVVAEGGANTTLVRTT
jgi:hypothetical protein